MGKLAFELYNVIIETGEGKGVLKIEVKLSIKIVWNHEKWLLKRSEVLFFSECFMNLLGDDMAEKLQLVL